MGVNTFFAIIGILLAIYIIDIVRKNNFDIGESIIWISGTLVIIIIALFPNIITCLSNLVGIEYAPSLFFLLCLIFVVLINFRNSKKILKQQEKIISLCQEVAILKANMKNINKEENEEV